VIGWPGVVVEQEFQLKKGLAATIYTDYDTIAARNSCNIVDGQKQEYFYIMVRSSGFNDVSELFHVLELFKKLPGVNLNKFSFDLLMYSDTVALMGTQRFGETIPQDQSYYIVDAREDARVYLGFHEDISREDFRLV
jgi:hypothetical protein